MKKIIWTVVTIVIVIAIIVTALVSQKGNTATIKIAGLYPLTGGLASYGEPAQKAALIAVEDINATGGINGKKLELVSEDHKCDPKTMVSLFEKTVNVDGIHIMTSVACSGTVSAVAPNLEKNDTVLLGTVTSGSKLTAVSPNFYRNWASDGQEAKLLSNQVIAKGYKTVAVIYEETDYAKGLKIAMENDLKDSGVKIVSESFVSGATDVRTQLTKLQAVKADVLFVSVQTVPSGETVLTQIEQLKFQPKALFVNDNILKAAPLLTNHTALLDGAIGGDYVFHGSDGLNALLAKYKAKYGQDCPQVNICAAEYDAIAMIAQGIKENGETSAGVKSYLSHAKYQGISGTISFDSNNDRSDANYSLFVIKGGKAVDM